MDEAYLGQIMLVAFNYAPRNWALCNGAILPIAQNQALFALLGTNYGGDGVTTFALPDLRGRLPVHRGQGPGLGNYVIGQVGGVETVTLTALNLPKHNHMVTAVNANANQGTPGGGIWAIEATAQYPVYSSTTPPDSVMNPGALGTAGGNQPHSNLQPYLAMNYCICTAGLFPPRD